MRKNAVTGNKQDEKQLKLIAYVPQGRSARLTRTSFDVGGLYTDDFSICNIIVCIGQEKIVLIHADAMTHPAAIIREIEWVGKNRETIFFIKKAGKEVNEHITLNYPPFKKVKFTTHEVNDKFDGIFVSFEAKRDYDIHSQVKFYLLGTKLKNLSHYLHEDQYLTVRKTEQLIGFREKWNNFPIYAEESLFIFDGNETWIDPPSLLIDTSNDLTKEEMAIFEKTDNLTQIEQKLNDKIIPMLIKEEISLLNNGEGLAEQVAIHLKRYLQFYHKAEQQEEFRKLANVSPSAYSEEKKRWVNFLNSKIVDSNQKKERTNTRFHGDFSKEDIEEIKREFPDCRLQ